jgi:hypothetical protein
LRKSGPPYQMAVQAALAATPMWGPNYNIGASPSVYRAGGEGMGINNTGIILKCNKVIRGEDIGTRRVPYYSAYIWIILEICDPDNLIDWLDENEKWRYYLPLFEHGDIADGTTFRILKRALVRKAVSMIREIEGAFPQVDDRPGVYFRYLCAIDDPGAPPWHGLAFDVGGADGDRLPELLRAEADDAMRKRLFEARDAASEDRLESSCHLPELVGEFYRSLERP